MQRLRILCFLFHAFTLALLAACVPTGVQPTESQVTTPVARVDLSWPHDPEVRIVRVTFCCSVLMSPNEEKAHLAEAQIWGDGRIIWFEREATQRVLIGFMGEEQIVNLLEGIAEAGFLSWEDYYSSELPPTDTPARCIEIHLQFQSKQVCELDFGAPPAFEEIYMNLTRGAGTQGTDFVPETGYLSSLKFDEPVPGADNYPIPEPDLEWPSELGISPAEAIQGIWISGEPLAKIWRAAVSNSFHMPVVTDESGSYRLVVQVPGVSWVEPPER